MNSQMCELLKLCIYNNLDVFFEAEDLLYL